MNPPETASIWNLIGDPAFYFGSGLTLVLAYLSHLINRKLDRFWASRSERRRAARKAEDQATEEEIRRCRKEYRTLLWAITRHTSLTTFTVGLWVVMFILLVGSQTLAFLAEKSDRVSLVLICLHTLVFTVAGLCTYSARRMGYWGKVIDAATRTSADSGDPREASKDDPSKKSKK